MPTLRATVLANLIVEESLDDGELSGYYPRVLSLANAGTSVTLPDSSVTLEHRIYAEITADTTIDLTAITDTLYGTLDLKNERLLAYSVKNTGHNSSTIGPGTTNPYNFADSTTLKPNSTICVYCPEDQPTVSSTQKTIRVQPGSACAVTLVMVFGKAAS